MSTQFTYRILLIAPEGASYNAARAAMAQVTGEAADATATWREATDDTEGYAVTHRVADMVARGTTVAALPGLQAQIGGSFHVLESGRGTPMEGRHATPAEAMTAAGVSFTYPVLDEQGEPTGEYALEPNG